MNHWITNIGITIVSGSALWLCQIGYSSLERLARIEEQTKTISREVEKSENNNQMLQSRIQILELRIFKLESGSRSHP